MKISWNNFTDDSHALKPRFTDVDQTQILANIFLTSLKGSTYFFNEITKELHGAMALMDAIFYFSYITMH